MELALELAMLQILLFWAGIIAAIVNGSWLIAAITILVTIVAPAIIIGLSLEEPSKTP